MHEPLVAGKILVMLLGFVVAYKAYEGYRRHRSSAMFYLAIGFALISIGTAIEGLLFEVFEMDIYLAGAIQMLVAAAGMVTILYSLFGNHSTRLRRRGDERSGEDAVADADS